MAKEKDLGQILLERAFIKAPELKAAQETAKRTGKKLGEVLLSQNLVTPETMATVLSFQYGAPIIDLKQFDIQPAALALIPEEIARENNILPLAVDGNVLTVAMEDPGNSQLMDKLTSLSRKRIRPVIPLHGGLRASIDANYSRTAEIATAVEAIIQLPVVQAVDMIIAQAVKARASGIRIEPRGDRLAVRYRIDGVLREVVALPLGVHAALLARIKAMAGMDVAEQHRPQDGRFSTTVADRLVGFRVATAKTAHGERMVLRILAES